MDTNQTTIDIGRRVGQYIQLRDKIDAIKKKHKEELEPFESALHKLNTMLLGHLNAVGTDSAQIKGIGTVYKKELVSATMADAKAFRDYIIDNKDWDTADIRPNKTAVRAFVDTHGHAPAGVNFSVAYDVGVRRDSGK